MSFEFDDYAKSIADMRALSGAQLPILYTTDPGQEGVWHCVTDVSPDDNTGTLIAGDDLQMTRIYEGPINVKWFGALADGTTDDTVAIQDAIDAAGLVAPASVFIPQNCNFDLSDLIIPYNVSIKYYGPTNEEINFLNNRKGSSAPVNEFNISSPYHSGLILETYDDLQSPASPAPAETSTKRGASLVVRRNGASTYQCYHSALGKQENLIFYDGVVTITVAGTTTTPSTTVTITLNDTSYTVDILYTDTTSGIVTKIHDISFGDYWIKKEIVGSSVKLYPRKETTLMITTAVVADPTHYHVYIDDDTYTVDVTGATTTWKIADIIISSIEIAVKYVAYRIGSNIVFYPKAGGKSISSCSFSNVPAGVTLTPSIVGYSNNKYSRISIAQTGTVGIGMWNARSYQMEVANTLRILSNSEENIGGTGSGTNAMFILENESDIVSKMFLLQSSGSLSIYANDKTTRIFDIDNSGNITFVPSVKFQVTGHSKNVKLESGGSLSIYADDGTTQIFNIDNSGNIASGPSVKLQISGHSKTLKLESNGSLSVYADNGTSQIFNMDNTGIISLTPNMRSGRFTFGTTSRFITAVSVSGEDMIYFTNNAGTNYVARISDANGYEQKVGSSFIPLRADATTTQTGLVMQSTASADTAAPAAGATPTKAEFDALLTELRDLKTKMRTAGLLHT